MCVCVRACVRVEGRRTRIIIVNANDAGAQNVFRVFKHGYGSSYSGYIWLKSKSHFVCIEISRAISKTYTAHRGWKTFYSICDKFTVYRRVSDIGRTREFHITVLTFEKVRPGIIDNYIYTSGRQFVLYTMNEILVCFFFLLGIVSILHVNKLLKIYVAFYWRMWFGITYRSDRKSKLEKE